MSLLLTIQDFYELNPTPSQVEMFEARKRNGDSFDTILELSKDKVNCILITTPEFIFTIGVRGGLTSKFNR